MEVFAQYIWVVWDLVTVAVLYYLVWQAAVRGLIRTLISLAGYAVAAVVANLVSPILAGLAYDYLVRDALTLLIMGRLERFLSEGGALAEGLMDSIPNSLRTVMNPDLLQSAVPDADLSVLVEGIIDAALREPVVSLIQSIVFLIVFTLALFLVRHVSRLFGGVYRIPFLGNLNTLLGGVLGVVQAVLILLIAAVAVHMVIAFSGGGFFWMNERVMDNSYVWRAFYRWTAF